MKILCIGLAAVVAVVTASSITAAADGVIRVSCTQNGKIVYRENIAVDTSANRRLEIASANSKALCVFLKAEVDDPAMPVATDHAIAGLISGNNEDLAAAIAYISTEAVGTPYGNNFNEGMKSFSKLGNAFTANSENTVNLTIGIYKGTSYEDILNHWTFIKGNTKILGRMSPSIEQVGDITVVSVRQVADSDAAEVCEEALLVASGCVAVF